MTNNPYFLPERNPENYVITLLSDTVGLENIPINVFEIPELMDYEVIFNGKLFESEKQYGFSEISSNGRKIIYLNEKFYGSSFEEVKQDDTKRRHCRFTLAHELGHCTIPEHRDVVLQNILLNKNNVYSKQYSFKKEYEANIFAAQLLIPSKTITNIYSFGQTFDRIVNKISIQYDTSFLAAALRTASLMKDSICICLQINKNSGTIINLKYSKGFEDYKQGLFISKNSIPYSGSLASALIKGSTTLCNKQIYNNPKDWFPGFYGSENVKLYEWTFDMGENIITFLELIDTSIYSLYIN